MARAGKRAFAIGAAVLVAARLKFIGFVPGPTRRVAAPAAAAATAATVFAPAAFADEIGNAAKKLGDASYDFASEVDWKNGIFLQAPGKFQPLQALKAIDKMIVLGAAADPKALSAAADAHHKAIASISGANGVTSRADWDEVNAALGRVFASVPRSMMMDVYNSVKAITDKGVPVYMKSLVKGADAEKAYAGFLEFKDVVAKNEVASAGPAATPLPADAISEAAKRLSEQSYPFLKEVNWLSDVYLKPIPGASADKVLAALDKAIIMGARVDGNALKAAAEAHHTAISHINSKGVPTLADYTAINNALGHVIASVPKATVMDVYNAFAGLVGPEVPSNMFNGVNAVDAYAAAKAFYAFKDVVAANQV